MKRNPRLACPVKYIVNANCVGICAPKSVFSKMLACRTLTNEFYYSVATTSFAVNIFEITTDVIFCV